MFATRSALTASGTSRATAAVSSRAYSATTELPRSSATTSLTFT
ncbi:hypothetical protein ACFRPV_36245 [Kitasatospora sp. NPDC056808]